jgi:hypothetical protein
MYELTSTKIVRSPRESFLLGNWLELSALDLPPMDVVIGDKSIDNVDFASWGTLFSEIAGILAEDGRLIAHVGFPDPAYAGHSFESLFASWGDRLAEGTVDTLTAVAGLWEDLLSASASETSRRLSLEPFRSSIGELRALRSKNALAKAFLDSFGDAISGSWTSFDQDDMDAAASPYFERRGSLISSDYFAARCQPILVYRKN